MAMSEVLLIGEKIWVKKWERRLWLFDTLCLVNKCGGERKELEKVQERFIKWTIVLNRRFAEIYDNRGDGKRNVERKGKKENLEL